MERSLTARLARPLGLPLLRGPARPSGGSRSARRAAPRPGLARARTRALASSRASWRAQRALRIALLRVLIALPLLGGGWLSLRNSPLVSVEHVQISGVHGAGGERDRSGAGVRRAAHEHARRARRRRCWPRWRRYRVVRAVRAEPSFPHGLRIEVDEQLPVAALLVAALRTAVAADGVVLGPALALRARCRASSGRRRARRRASACSDATLLAALRCSAPRRASLARHVARMYSGPQGLTVAMRNGLLVYFGDASAPTREVAVARARARRPQLRGRLLRRRAPARASRRGLPRGCDAAGCASAAAQRARRTSVAGSQESTVSALAAGLTSGRAQPPTSATDAPTPSATRADAAANTANPPRDRPRRSRPTSSSPRHGIVPDSRHAGADNTEPQLEVEPMIGHPQAGVESPAICNVCCETASRR